MKFIFSAFGIIFLLLGVLCLEIAADLTLQQMQNKLENATLISGLNIQKDDIYKANWTKNAFKFYSNRGKNEFLLLTQFDSTCGTTSAEMVLHYYGQDVGQKEIWEYGGVHVIQVGSFPSEIREALNGLGVPARWFHYATLDHLKQWITADRPPIILLRFGEVLHYVVVVGYNPQGDFLLADPNGIFRWISGNDLVFGWSLNAPGLPNEAYPVRNGFEKFALRTLTPAVDILTGGANVIVPDAPPNKHFPPNYTPVLFSDPQTQQWTSGKAVWGGDRFNPTWTTDPWEETFTFREEIADYRVSGVVPAEFENLGGLEPAYIQGHQQVDNKTVKVWGRITPGTVTKGKIFVFVRGYKEPLYGDVKTVSQTQNQRYYSTWDWGSTDWEDSWHTFTFPGDVVGYTISAGIDFEDRFGAKFLEHHSAANQVKFKISLRHHVVEKNGITVNVTAHYEPVVPANFTLSSSGTLSNIPSGDSRTVTVKVTSTKGYPMQGVSVRFIDTDDSEIAFSPTAATTNSSGVATSTMKTGSHGNANFRVEIDGLSSKTYNVSVARKLKEHIEERWFSSRHAGEDCRRVFGVKICTPDLTPDSYTASEYIDVPSSVSIHSYSLSTHVPPEDLVTKPYVQQDWRSGNRVHLRIRFREHIVESNDILVRVHREILGECPVTGCPLES